MNKINLVSTKFTNIKSGEESFGYRIYDDYSSEYNNLLDTPIDDDLDLLAQAIEDSHEMLDFVRENETGVDINGTWYDWEEIQPVFEGKDNEEWTNLSMLSPVQ